MISAPTPSLHLCDFCGAVSTSEKYCCAGCQTMASWTAGALKEASPSEFQHLDQADFQKIYQQPNSASDFLFYVEGIHCSSCVHMLEALPRYCDSIRSARVQFASSTLAVRLTEGGSLAKAAMAIKALGYTPTLLAPAEKNEVREREQSRASLRRIAVAGFCAGNIMLFVVPVYAGLDGAMKDLFNWIGFFLFLPVLFYSAKPFYRGALTALKYHTVSVDLPIAVALLTGFLFSTFNLLRGNGAIYFDSTASFLFLILAARHIQKTVQKTHLAAPTLRAGLKSEKYHCESSDGKSRIVPFSNLAQNDILVLSAGQTIPADGRLLSPGALLDLSLLNGEALPKHFTQGMELFGGTKVLNDAVRIQLTSTFEASKIGRLCAQLENGATIKSKFASFTDALAQKLIIWVFAVAICFFAVYAFVDVSEAFNRALALIVLACPCALAFGTPMAYGFALRTTVRRGIFVKDPNIFDRVLEIKNIFFDKTGTLTEGRLRLTNSYPENLSAELKAVCLALESRSFHPVAFALREAWQDVNALPAVTEGRELVGRGVAGTIRGKHYELHTLDESVHDTEVAVEILENKVSVARLYFSDALRKDSKAVVRALSVRGMNCFILSGDRNTRSIAVGEACGIAAGNVHGELFPEDKEKYIRALDNTCMLGDGANDSLALKAASVGIAVKGSVDLSLTHADVYFTRGGLEPLIELIEIAVKTRVVLRRNLTISFVYNFTGGVLALAGFISPLSAAVLMPVSSLAILGSTYWGFREKGSHQ